MALTGKAAIYGANGAFTWSGIASNVSFLHEGADFEDTLETQKLLDAAGKTVGFAGGDDEQKISIDYYPAGGASANNTIAQAKLAAAPPPAMSKVTLSGFDLASINGDWLYIGGAKLKTNNKNYAKIILPLVKHGGTDITTVVT